MQQASQDMALHLLSGIAAMEPFELVSDGSTIPVFAWRLKGDKERNWTLYDLSDRLRMRGWLVPAYPLPDNLTGRTVQRIVVRNGLSMDLAESLLKTIREETQYLESLTTPLPDSTQHGSFKH